MTEVRREASEAWLLGQVALVGSVLAHLATRHELSHGERMRVTHAARMAIGKVAETSPELREVVHHADAILSGFGGREP